MIANGAANYLVFVFMVVKHLRTEFWMNPSLLIGWRKASRHRHHALMSYLLLFLSVSFWYLENFCHKTPSSRNPNAIISDDQKIAVLFNFPLFSWFFFSDSFRFCIYYFCLLEIDLCLAVKKCCVRAEKVASILTASLCSFIRTDTIIFVVLKRKGKRKI